MAEPRRFYLGVDGGATRTRAFLCDASGSRRAQGESGDSNPNHTPPEEVSRHLAEAVRAACHGLGCGPEEIVSAFFGLAGITDEPGRELIRRQAQACGADRAQIGVDHDIRVALAGGLETRPGIALIVGTGSSCYGRDARGRTQQTSGWDWLVGDEGSGFFLGREAMIAAVRMADGRDSATALQGRVFAWLGIRDVAEIPTRLYRPVMSKHEIAGLAPILLDLAEGGDVPAVRILERGAQSLAELVASNHRQLPTGSAPEVVVTGGLGTADRIYRPMIYEAIRRAVPGARVGPPALAPAVGAALLALEQVGLPVTPDLLHNLKAHA